eukprot:8288498-Ditylum_brightwellii.AAC.1
MANKNKRITLGPNTKESFCVFVDADFSEKWFKKTTRNETNTSESKTGFIVTYTGCPIPCAPKLQTVFTLSMIEAEHAALSTAVSEAIVMMTFLKGIQTRGITKINSTPDIYCKMFEDNLGALELERVPKMKP